MATITQPVATTHAKADPATNASVACSNSAPYRVSFNAKAVAGDSARSVMGEEALTRSSSSIGDANTLLIVVTY
ncbi:MAG TPA: hypothetical protein VGG45_10015 [Terracidiphilus sp.]